MVKTQGVKYIYIYIDRYIDIYIYFFFVFNYYFGRDSEELENKFSHSPIANQLRNAALEFLALLTHLSLRVTNI